MFEKLGKWAVIDIETSGLDSQEDQIIDIGFLQFEGTQLVKKFTSLVRFPPEDEYFESPPKLSQFIQKLTGIKEKQLLRAPTWNEVRLELQELYGHHLIAHNASFEQSFLEGEFDVIDDGSARETYEDSLFYLSLLFPHRSTLKLEEFICDWDLAEKETHRGLEDSVDLLKVLLLGTWAIRQRGQVYGQYKMFLERYELKSWWYAQFFCLSEKELKEIASSIEFDLIATYESIPPEKFFPTMNETIQSSTEKLFPLEFSGKNIESLLKKEEKVKERIPFYKYYEQRY